MTPQFAKSSSIIYIISAPSGSGKSTLVNELRRTVTNLDFSISYTTRKPRGSEQNGREYFFVARWEFEEMIRRGEFLEYAGVFGNYYGTARRFLRQAEGGGRDLLLDIDVQGAAQVKAQFPQQAVSIFILPPSRDELERRLRRRSEAEGAVDEEVIRRRLRTATGEIENYSKYDYILVNDRLEQSIDELKAIVLAERFKRLPTPLQAAQVEVVAAAERCLLANSQPRIQAIVASFARAHAPGSK